MSDNIISSAELLPKFSIRKVIISETAVKSEAKILCSLSRPREINYENWLGSSEFNPFIKYYFIAVNKNLSNDKISGLSSPSGRLNFISSESGKQPIHMWESKLGPQTAEQLENQFQNPFGFCGWNSVSLQEILQGQYFITDPMIATQGLEPMHPDAMDDPEQYNTYFEIDVSLLGENVLGAPATRLDIYAFSQVDIRAMQEQFNINRPGFLASLGSPMIIERCLSLDKTNQYNTRLKVPETRKVYFTEDGTPYQGQKHYHPSNSPGPNGYVGWMSGPRSGGMGERYLLSVREVSNNKVVYRSSTQRATNYEGRPLTRENFFSGFTMEGEVFAADDGLLSFGDDIREALASHMGHFSPIGPRLSDARSQQNIERLSQSQRHSAKLRDLTMSSVRRGNISSGQAHSWLDINEERSFHASLIWINLGQIIADNSRFGYLYTLHKDKENSADILKQIALLSTVKNLSIYRQRVTNEQSINNFVSSPAHGVYDTNEEQRLVISTSKTLSNASIVDSLTNEKANIFEVGASNDTMLKGIVVRDYDLFENYNYGKYRYLVEATLEDGILKALEVLHSQFETVLRMFSKYLYEAQRPYLDYRDSGYYNGSQFANGQQDQSARAQARSSGNYIHSTDSFTEEFKARGNEYAQVISDMVEGYVFVYYILTARDTFNQQMSDQLKRDLMPENATLDGIEYFHNLCNKLYSRVSNLINVDKNTKRLPSLGASRLNIQKSHRFPDKLLKVSGKTKAIAAAVEKNKVFIRPNLDVGALANRRLNAVSIRDFTTFNVSSAINNVLSRDTLVSTDSTRLDTVYELQTIHSETVELPQGPGSNSAYRIAAAIEASKAGPAISTTDGFFDEVKEVDNLLSQYGGASIESMASKAGISKDTSLKTDVKTESVSKGIQAALVESITKSGNSKSFIKETEEKYKDHSLNKKALGDMFENIKSAVSNIEVRRDTKLIKKHKEKVLTQSTGETNRLQKESQIKENKDTLKNEKFLPHTFDDSGALVKTEDSGKYGVVVYVKEGDNFKGAVLASNVSISEPKSSESPKSNSRSPQLKIGDTKSPNNNQKNFNGLSIY